MTSQLPMTLLSQKVTTTLGQSETWWILGKVNMGNYADSIIRDGSTIGSGKVLGNIFGGLIREGDARGSGNVLGNVKNGIVRDGSTVGSGDVLFNVKAGKVRDGATLAVGNAFGRLCDFPILGMEREPQAEMVAAHHFFVKKIL
jgi:hypothetical protein